MTERQDKHPKRCETIYPYQEGHPSWGVNPRIGKTPDAEANKIAEEAYRNITSRNPVPSSTELITMANLEWKNREERRGIHNREDWCCGWMAGFLSEKKPNWTKEQIEAAEKRGYERALDDLGVLHGEDARKFNEELKNPSPLTPEAAEVMRKARELARK